MTARLKALLAPDALALVAWSGVGREMLKPRPTLIRRSLKWEGPHRHLGVYDLGKKPEADIWCRCVSVSPAPHISGAKRGERVRPLLVRPFTAVVRTTWSSARQGSKVPGTGPTRAACR